MKSILYPSACALVLSIFFGPPAVQAQSLADAVKVEVRVESSQERKDVAKTTVDQIVQHKVLTITLSGKAKSPETRVGTWTAYGRNVKNNELTILDSGDFKIDLSSGSQKIESKKINADYTPEYAITKNTHSGGSVKKVAAEGKKYVGYRVVVRDGTNTVGEASEPQGIGKEKPQ